MWIKTLFWMVSVAALAVLSGQARAAEYAGRYEGDGLVVTVTAMRSGYGGEIVLGQQHFRLRAAAIPDQLVGSFASQGNEFAFAASLDGDTLVLVTDGKTYKLHRTGAPTGQAQPPQKQQPAGAMSLAGAAEPNALGDYAALNGSQFGTVLGRQFPPNTSALSALQVTFPDLARFFGARPTILGAYEDQKDHRSMGVAYAAQLGGQAVKGIASAQVQEQGTIVVVMFCLASAPQGEIARLMQRPAPPPAGNNQAAPAASAPSAPQVPLQTYNFPDGTGSIGLAPGWTTNAPTIFGVTLVGPAGQKVVMAVGSIVLTQEHQMVRQHQQSLAYAARMGGMRPPPMVMLVAPFSPDPETAFRYLTQAINVLNRQQGLPLTTIERVVDVTKVPPTDPSNISAAITFDFTQSSAPDRHMRAIVSIEYYLTSQARDSWGFQLWQVGAPVDTFQQDLPIMMAQCRSIRPNTAACQDLVNRKLKENDDNTKALIARTQQIIAARQNWFSAHEAAIAQRQAGYDQQHRDWERNQLLSDRGHANFDEYIRGYRTVVDTQTGYSGQVDLGNVHRVVENLNYYDPGRYREIPLRDELYPLPGQQQR